MESVLDTDLAERLGVGGYGYGDANPAVLPPRKKKGPKGLRPVQQLPQTRAQKKLSKSQERKMRKLEASSWFVAIEIFAEQKISTAVVNTKS